MIIFKKLILVLIVQLVLIGIATSISSALVYADEVCKDTNIPCCGDRSNKDISVRTAIDIGCQGKGNPIEDASFAIIKILSDGVGLVIIASFILAGIQYTSSRGEPQATAQAEKRIRSNVIALFVFIFGYALLNYIVPGAFLK